MFLTPNGNLTSVPKYLQLDQSRFWIDNEILFCEIRHQDAHRYLNTVTIKRYLKSVIHLCAGKKVPCLIDLRNTDGTFSINAAKTLATSIAFQSLVITEVYVVNSIKMKLLINSYKRIYEPLKPFVIFDNYNKALNYSIQIKNTQN